MGVLRKVGDMTIVVVCRIKINGRIEVKLGMVHCRSGGVV